MPQVNKKSFNQDVQDFYNLSIQYNDLKLLLYSNNSIVLGNTLISIAQKLLSKLRYLSFKAKSQKDS